MKKFGFSTSRENFFANFAIVTNSQTYKRE